MNPLEDRLHEYLARHEAEPIHLTSVTTQQPQFEDQSQPISGRTLFSHHRPVTQGATLMSNQPSTTRVRIYTHLTQARFFHVEDALAIGKVRLFAGTYRRGDGMNSHAHHFLDLADARVIFAALAQGEQGFNHQEYKGTPPLNGRAAVSRVLSVTVKGDNVYIELKTGPGQLMATGAIKPAGQPKVAINVGFKRYAARRMATEVLAYLQAWDVLRLLAHRPVVGQPAPYTLVPMTNQTNGVAMVVDGQPKPNGVAGGNRPMTRKGQPPLQYGDNRPVDMTNATEVQTFQKYMAEMKTRPVSKPILLAYYQQSVVGTL